MSATNTNVAKMNKPAKLSYAEAKERISKDKSNKHKRTTSRRMQWEEI